MEGIKEGLSSVMLIVSCGLLLIFIVAAVLCVIQHLRRDPNPGRP